MTQKTKDWLKVQHLQSQNWAFIRDHITDIEKIVLANDLDSLNNTENMLAHVCLDFILAAYYTPDNLKPLGFNNNLWNTLQKKIDIIAKVAESDIFEKHDEFLIIACLGFLCYIYYSNRTKNNEIQNMEN